MSLEQTINDAWEQRTSLAPGTASAGDQRGRGPGDCRPQRRAPARRREAGRSVGHAPVAEEGGAAVVPPQRQRPDSCRRAGLLRQGAAEVLAPRRRAHACHRRSRRAACRRPPRQLHREERRADAVLRQHRRLCRRGHDGRHLGHRRLVRADRQERPPVGRRRHRRRARAAAGQSDDHRGQLLHRRPLGGRRGRHRRGERGARHGGLHRPEHQDLQPRNGRDLLRPRAGRLGRRRRFAALARVQPVLRGDRQAGRCEDAGEDQHQRVACGRRFRP